LVEHMTTGGRVRGLVGEVAEVWERRVVGDLQALEWPVVGICANVVVVELRWQPKWSKDVVHSKPGLGDFVDFPVLLVAHSLLEEGEGGCTARVDSHNGLG